MTSSTTSSITWRFALVAASALTVVVAVGADLLSGSHPVHAAALGAASAVLGAVRVRLVGSFRWLFGLASAAIVAQPVAHAALKLSGGAAHGDDLLTIDVTESLLPLLLTVATVVAVGIAESAIELATGVREWWGALLHRLALPLPLPSRTVSNLPLVARVLPLRPSAGHRYAVRRGPPLAIIA